MLRDHYQDLQAAGYVVLGISPDDKTSHSRFIDKYSLPFSLLADTDKSICEAYVCGKRNMYGRKYMGVARTTFVIDEQGIITDIIKKVKTADHAAQVMR